MMAPPPLPASDDLDDESIDDVGTPTNTFLTNMNAAHREEEYEQEFGRMIQPLHKIDEPALCKAHPSLTKEIVAAYFRHTTFNVKVWVNYDSMSKKFFVDNRYQDCGKLSIYQEDLTMLRGHNPSFLELNRVRLDIGTPFTTLILMTLEAAPTKLSNEDDISVEINPCTIERHPLLVRFIRAVSKEIEIMELAYGQKGLQIRDIEEIARMLRRVPNMEEVEFKRRYPRSSLWMHLNNDEENPGYVEGIKGAVEKRAAGFDRQRGLANSNGALFDNGRVLRPRVIQL